MQQIGVAFAGGRVLRRNTLFFISSVTAYLSMYYFIVKFGTLLAYRTGMQLLSKIKCELLYKIIIFET